MSVRGSNVDPGEPSNDNPTAGPSEPQNRLTRNNPFKSRSVYKEAASETSRRGKLAVRRLGNKKGKGRASELGDLSSESEAVSSGDEQDPDYRNRTKRGWSTRWQREQSRESRLGTPASSIVSVLPLPSDDLLHALHRQASKLYYDNGILFEPTKHIRRTQWGSKKRLLLQAEGVNPLRRKFIDKECRESGDDMPQDDIQESEEDAKAEGTKRRRAGRRLRSGPTRIVESEQESDASSEESEDDEGSYEPSIQRDGEDNETDEVAEHDGEEADTGDKSRKKHAGGAPKGRSFRQRDMYRALDGTALLAFGMLVEQYVSRELRRAGYRPLARTPFVNMADGDDEDHRPIVSLLSPEEQGDIIPGDSSRIPGNQQIDQDSQDSDNEDNNDDDNDSVLE